MRLKVVKWLGLKKVIWSDSDRYILPDGNIRGSTQQDLWDTLSRKRKRFQYGQDFRANYQCVGNTGNGKWHQGDTFSQMQNVENLQTKWCSYKTKTYHQNWFQRYTKQLKNGLCYILSCFSHVQLFAILRTVACQAPLSIGFSRQEYWSGLPCLPPGDLPNPGLNLFLFHLLHWQAGFLTLAPPEKPQTEILILKISLYKDIFDVVVKKIKTEYPYDNIEGPILILMVNICSHWIRRQLLPVRKVMTNLDSVLKNRDITL